MNDRGSRFSTKCDRCGEACPCRIMSMFNTQMICDDCKAHEERSPRYKQALEAEEAAIRSGNLNFPGIGGAP